MDYIKDIIEIENTIKDWSRYKGCKSTSMILHYHPIFSAQKRRKDNDAEPLKFSLKHSCLRRLLGMAA
jgi:hypothetical protein